jgi:multicomponent Na+:H+ antiporter subunit E
MTNLVPTPTGARGRLWRLAAQRPATLVLAVLWLLLWGDLRSWGTAAAGLIVGVLVVVVFPLPTVGLHGTVRPVRLAVLAWRFATDLFVASFQVAWTALRRSPPPVGGVVAVRLRPAPDVLFVLTAVLSSLVPGSLVVEIDARRAVLYLHVLDLDRSGGPDGIRRQTRQLEERVLHAFAARADLTAAGLRP